MLTLRKRKGRPHIYIRGTVKIGHTVTTIAEHSTGTSDRALAEAYKAKLQRDTEIAALHGRTVAAVNGATFAQAVVNYGASNTHRADISRARILFEHFGDVRLAEITAEAFDLFCAEALPGKSPNTQHRYRTTLRGLFRAAGVKPPEIKGRQKKREVVAWLPLDAADALIASYCANARPPAALARYSGLRASELAALLRRDVDRVGKAILVRGVDGGGPKNGRDRIVPLVPQAEHALAHLLDERRDDERLFLTPKGEAYVTGGNPWLHSHWAACEAAKVSRFRFHDWRHHWATWAVRPVEKGGAGIDLVTLMRIGGWSSLSQVQRYAAASLDGALDMLSRVR